MKKLSPHPDCIYGIVGVIENDGRFLMIQRSQQVRAPGKWCFPGGGIEPGETPEQAIVREFQEELGVNVAPEGKLWEWLRDDGKLHLLWWRCRLLSGPIKARSEEVADWAWMSDEEIRRHPDMIANNVRFLDHYRASPIQASEPAPHCQSPASHLRP